MRPNCGWLIGLGTLLLLFMACNELPKSPNLTSPLMNSAVMDSILVLEHQHCPHFPGKEFDEIYVWRLDEHEKGLQKGFWTWDEAHSNGKLLLPAHEADVRVAVNLAARHPYLAGLACHEPEYAFCYFKEKLALAALTVSSKCGTVRFYPCAPHVMDLRGFLRLMKIVEELNLDNA